ncbi:MAG: aminotransferase class I/II-fold pyridoxal phosphate-dependent enzyme [Cellulosilyticaceae bacterium]
MKNKHYLHGGDLDAAAKLYGLDRNKIWDFSGNINPLGTSKKARELMCKDIDFISTYPDRNYESLKETLATYCHTLASHILVGNGTSELISLAIHHLSPKKALTLAPTYSEYEREIQMVGGLLDYYTLNPHTQFTLDIEGLCQILDQSYDLLILCNPNNPTSTVLTRKELESILAYCKVKGVFVMIDETYIEFCDEPHQVSAISLTTKFENLLVLRGISKFFSAPGLRFGYGICSNIAFLTALKKKQNPWSVNMLATIGAKAMFEDIDYISSTHSLFVKERARLTAELSSWDAVQVFIPQANFVLLKLLDTPLTGSEIANQLIAQNMLIRDASSFPSLDETYIRFCFLAPHQNDKLLALLKTLLQ